MWSFLDPDDQSRAEDSYPQLDRQLSSQGRGLCQPKVCGDPYNPNASLTEGNLFSSVLSCRERGQGTSAYTKLQEILFLSETSERSVKCNAWGLVCDPRIWVVLWFQEVHVKYHPSLQLSLPHNQQEQSCSTRGDFQSYHLSVVSANSFPQPPFPKRPSAGVSVKFLAHLSSSRLPKQGTWQRT